MNRQSKVSFFFISVYYCADVTFSDKRTLKEVQLDLAKEELEALARGGAVQESSVCVFVMMALDIEESQCVCYLLHPSPYLPFQQA